jgi:hypothetical protein
LLDTGDKVFFTVNDGLEKETALISIVVDEFTDNKAIIHLSATDTNLAPGNYYYDI